jgi:hypothetical protein
MSSEDLSVLALIVSGLLAGVPALVWWYRRWRRRGGRIDWS